MFLMMPQQDLGGAVKQIATFMGKSLSDDVVDNIARVSTFDALRVNPTTNMDFLLHGELRERDKSFMRKGNHK